MEINTLTEKIIGAAIEVHRALDPSLLEKNILTQLRESLCEYSVYLCETT